MEKTRQIPDLSAVLTSFQYLTPKFITATGHLPLQVPQIPKIQYIQNLNSSIIFTPLLHLPIIYSFSSQLMATPIMYFTKLETVELLDSNHFTFFNFCTNLDCPLDSTSKIHYKFMTCSPFQLPLLQFTILFVDQTIVRVSYQKSFFVPNLNFRIIFLKFRSDQITLFKYSLIVVYIKSKIFTN